MFHNIVHQPIIFPPDILISKNAKKLMLNLLNKDPKQRMSAVEILKDPWLKGATLEKINSKQYVPPFKPSLLAYNF
jgi:serine/threonine protein kinase